MVSAWSDLEIGKKEVLDDTDWLVKWIITFFLSIKPSFFEALQLDFFEL